MATKNAKAATKAVKSNKNAPKAARKTAPLKGRAPAARSDEQLKAASALETNKLACETWAVGTQVEHPAHGHGFVSGHTQTDGVVLVDFGGSFQFAGELEVVADELKLVADAKPHKPHTEKKFNFPKRKHAVKQAKETADAIGTAREQNAAYAKLARRYQMNDRVVELNGHKREGNVFTVAPKGSGYLSVLFDGDTVATAKHICDLKKVDMTGRKVCIGDLVALRGTDELIGTVAEAHFTNDQATVQDKNGVRTGARLSKLKVWVAPKVKPDTTKFENLPLLSGFEYDDAEHVKVGNTSAIQVSIDRETLGGYDKHPILRLAEVGREKLAVKLRFKKNTQVRPIQSVPYSA